MIFLRAPESGRVKTRLARGVGEGSALALYKLFVKAVLSAVRGWEGRMPGDQATARSSWLVFCPKEKREMILDWLGRSRPLLAQSGGNLGRRMARAMDAAFKSGAQKAVILGTDVPQIRPELISRAFDVLDVFDVVAGPSFDGGYWLIGAGRDRYTPDLFTNINWSTPSVFSDTITRCRENGLTWTALDTLQDVDTLADLERIQKDMPWLKWPPQPE